MRKYLIEIICALVVGCLLASIAWHCTHKVAGPSSIAPADSTASTTDWTLIAQIVGSIIVAIIGSLPALLRAYKSSDWQGLESKAEELANEIKPLVNPKTVK